MQSLGFEAKNHTIYQVSAACACHRGARVSSSSPIDRKGAASGFETRTHQVRAVCALRDSAALHAYNRSRNA
jgi:hypothetical protein